MGRFTTIRPPARASCRKGFGRHRYNYQRSVTASREIDVLARSAVQKLFYILSQPYRLISDTPVFLLCELKFSDGVSEA